MGNPLSVNYPAWGLHCFKLPPATAELGGAGRANGWREGGANRLLMTRLATASLAKCSKRSRQAQTQSDTRMTCKAKGNIMASRLGKNTELYK